MRATVVRQRETAQKKKRGARSPSLLRSRDSAKASHRRRQSPSQSTEIVVKWRMPRPSVLIGPSAMEASSPKTQNTRDSHCAMIRAAPASMNVIVEAILTIVISCPFSLKRGRRKRLLSGGTEWKPVWRQDSKSLGLGWHRHSAAVGRS